MKTKNAFTLIEVMVVLSILAIIAILAYNFFGSSMKDATLKQSTVKIFNDMNAISGAYELYLGKHGQEPLASTIQATSGTNVLIEEGFIKAWPAVDPKVMVTGTPGPGYQLRMDWGNFPTDSSPWYDNIGYLLNVKLEVCLAVQDAYSTLGGVTPYDYNQGNGEPTPLPELSQFQAYCYNDSGVYSVIFNMGKEDF